MPKKRPGRRNLAKNHNVSASKEPVHAWTVSGRFKKYWVI